MIAVVDDDPEIADALSTWMGILGFETTVHGSAEKLLAWLQSNGNKTSRRVKGDNVSSCPLKAAILDINLPGINGIELAHKLRKQYRDLPMVLITALRHDEVQSIGSLPLGVSFIRKPFDLDVLEGILFQSKD
jgi:DNA-binding response OmpR family regulator